MTPGISRGIVEALDAGSLTATSVMTTSPWLASQAGALARFADRADIGLHLNLTQGAPLGPMPIIAPSHRLPGVGKLIRLKRTDIAALAEIAGEIDRQFDRFEAVFARAPDHVDGHQHTHALPPIAPLVVAALQRRGWRSWLRDSADRPSRIVRRGTCVAKALGIAALTRTLAVEARRGGNLTNSGFSGFSRFDPKTRYADLFARYLKAPGQRQLIMCHPGLVDDHLLGLDPVVETREAELRFLVSAGFREFLDRRGAILVRMTSLTD